MPYLKFELPGYPCQSDMWDSLRDEKRPVVIYGMGNGADKLIDRLGKYNVSVADFFASDGFVRGHSFHGKRVKSFSEICAEYDDFVILLSFASNRSEVLDMLGTMDLKYDMLVPDMPVADINEYFDRSFYNAHYEEILDAYNGLYDDDSRNLYAAILNYKLTGRIKYLFGAWSETKDIYSLFSHLDIVTAIDCGAYNGDTAREMSEFISELRKIYAIEPDHKNFAKLSKYSEAESEIEITPINAAAWSVNGSSVIQNSGNRNSTISATASYEHDSSVVRLVTVDGISDHVDYIKYDVEGAEREALIGSDATIRRDRPTICISVYHRSRDIFDIVNYMRKRYPEYKYYLRRTKCTPAWEIALICVPTETN